MLVVEGVCWYVSVSGCLLVFVGVELVFVVGICCWRFLCCWVVAVGVGLVFVGMVFVGVVFVGAVFVGVVFVVGLVFVGLLVVVWCLLFCWSWFGVCCCGCCWWVVWLLFVG